MSKRSRMPAATRNVLRTIFRAVLDYYDAPKEAPIVTPEDTLRKAGIGSRRQAKYQRRMSQLLAGRE